MRDVRDVSVYVHFPWCLRKCPYCDFATLPVERARIPHERYADAVLRELSQRAPTLSGARLWSVFFGGGTPSLWEPRALGRVLTGILGAFAKHAEPVEVTVECNPSSLDARVAGGLVEQGVDRLSLGVQSFDEGQLSFLGRLHDGAQARASLGAALAAAPRVSADLMFGMPGQRPEHALADARALLELGLSHVSAYALTVEPATPFGARQRAGALTLAPDGTFAETFTALRELFGEHGLLHYEVSNYARPGEQSQHNAHYWRGGEYLGLGAAAVGRLGPRRYRNHPDPARYMTRAGTPGVEVFQEALTGEDLVREALMLGLRTAAGVDLAALGRQLSLDPRAGREDALARAAQAGDVEDDGRVLRVPPARWLMLDGITARLF